MQTRPIASGSPAAQIAASSTDQFAGRPQAPNLKRNNDMRSVSPEDTAKRLRAGDSSMRTLLGVGQMTLGPSPEYLSDAQQIREAIASAHGHIQVRKTKYEGSDNIHLKSAARMLNRTLCLASPFNRGDSTLSSFASQQKHAGSYIRSFDHDLLIAYKGNDEKQKTVAALVDRTTAEKKKGAFHATSGKIPNVHTVLLAKLDIEAGKSGRARKTGNAAAPDRSLSEQAMADRPKMAAAGDAVLYDASLRYRVAVTKHVAGKLANAKNITVGAHNDYPAVMVAFDARKFLRDDFRNGDNLTTPAEAFNQFLMSYYTGIVNAEAAKMGLATATVERSSFGHLTPSVAPTGGSFRINLGTMPPAYAEAHIRALEILNSELSGFKGSLDQPYAVDKERFALSKQAGSLNESKNILELAFNKAEKGGKTVMSNTVRKLQNRNAVDAHAYRAHRTLAPKTDGPGLLHASLQALFSGISFTPNGPDSVRMSTKTAAEPYTMAAADTDAGAAPNATAADDAGLATLSDTYSGYLKEFSRRLDAVGSTGPDAETNKQLKALAKTLHGGNPEIASALDAANQMLMIHTLDKMGAAPVPAADTGYGSESDTEDPMDRSTSVVRGTKVTTHNGMRSLVTATASATNLLMSRGHTGTVGIAYDEPYFETRGAIANSDIAVTDVSKRDEEPVIILKDINACVTNGGAAVSTENHLAEKFPAAKVWIIDTTSAKTAQMQNVYQQFKQADEAELLYFASSGLKNEQAGADNNNYGTLRIFAKGNGADGNKAIGEILGDIEQTDKGVAMFSHEYRKTMKELGMVPTNSSIVVPVSHDIAMVDESFADGR